MSFTSPSGYDNAHCDLIDLKFYMPFDFFWTVNRALDIVCPDKVIFASYDYWPNFLWISSLKGIYTKIFAYRFKQSTFKIFPVIRNFFLRAYTDLLMSSAQFQKKMHGFSCYISAIRIRRH